MELWWRFGGWKRLRLTGADPVGSLRQLSQTVRLDAIRWEDELCVAFTVSRREFPAAERLAKRRGDRLTILREGGFPQLWKSAAATPILTGFLAALTAFTCWLPTRVFFISVEGNGAVPAALILEKAEQCGLYFGVSRRQLRSEQVKNGLLSLVPELSWAGVNTRGCTAVLTVRPRQRQMRKPLRLRGNIVAARDGIVSSVTAAAGTALCRPGEAVRKGEILISGLTDLGNATLETAAEGEVFADTEHRVTAVLPRKTLRNGQPEKIVRRYSVILQKNRINFYSDSGILYPGCGKMVEAIPWVLPGGWELPLSLVIETYMPAQAQACSRPRPENALREAVRRQVLADTVAGAIRQEAGEVRQTDGLLILEARLRCREMIGRTADGVYLEDDAKDVRTSGECGAG